MPGPAPVVIVLDPEQRDELRSLVRARKTPQSMALRGRIVLLADEGLSNSQISAELNCSVPTARKWRTRFAAQGVEGLADAPRPGPPPRITDEQISTVVERTLHTTPNDATHWSTRAMAAATGVSQTSVLRIWKAFKLQPHRVQEFKISTDEQFVDKVHDVVGL